MENHGDRPARSERRSISRRDFVKVAGTSGITAGLAGCTALGDEANANTVQWFANTDAADATADIQQGLYEAGLSQDITIEIIPGPSNTDAKQQQIQRWLDANLAEPDLIMMDSGWTIPFILRQQILNLTQSETVPDSIIQRVENDYFEASVQTAKHPRTDDLYGVPLFPDFPTMQYRRDLVEQAGYNPSQENWATESITWQKFSRVTRDVLDQNQDLQYGFTFQASAYEGLSCCDFNEFMSSWGGAYFGGRDTLFGPIGERPVTVNEQPVIDSIRMIRTFMRGQDDPHSLPGYAGNISPRAVIAWIEDSSLAPFTNGNAVMHRNWPYAIITNVEELGPERVGVMPIPYATTEQESKYKGIGGPVAALGGWHNTINPNTDKMDMVVQVLEAMMKKSFKLMLFEVLGLIPPEPQILQSREAQQVEIIGNYVEQLRVAGENAIPRPVTVVWPQQSTKIAQLVNNCYAGEIAPDAAMNQLQSDLTQIENYNERVTE